MRNGPEQDQNAMTNVPQSRLQSWTSWLPMVAAGLSVLAFLSVFFPVGTVFSGGSQQPQSLFDAEDGSQFFAFFLMILAGVLVVIAAIAFFVPRKPLLWVYPLVGIAVSVFGAVLYLFMFSVMGSAEKKYGIQIAPGSGSILGLVACGLLLIACIVALLAGLRARENAAEDSVDNGRATQAEESTPTPSSAEVKAPVETVPADASAAELQELAATKPELWEQIRQHPNCYPELEEWIKLARSMN